MRRLVLTSLAVVVASYVAWGLLMTRSKSVRLENNGLSLSFAISWGLGTDEKFRLTGDGYLFGPSSEWLSIWKRPYNSGLSVYRSKEKNTYYFGTVYRLFVLDRSSGAMKSSCDPADIPQHSELGKRLAQSAIIDRDKIDPGFTHLFRYVERDQRSGAIPATPPVSRYYSELKYLGRFGLVRSSGRGSEIRFVAPDQENEPRLSLDIHCG
ncbi:hypothetical protein ACFQI3_09160 [Hansschlegelia quercus]|uniref:Uncharacterized protein n=1 Tax=Hansschlegelia quercus TaxID=2528245 RepID=A0A4Q9GIZ3_9HYPH|nr:hypothetical protein [Hansschlegelia quercus]TBN54249.1 hypothetical protein EYR15_05235 [Hansschlegelia quercus]